MNSSEILALYRETKSIRATAKGAVCSPQVVRRILITHGIYPTERSREVARLLTLCYTVDEIAGMLNISPHTVVNHLPYTKGSYAVGLKTKNAKRIAACRARKEEGR